MNNRLIAALALVLAIAPHSHAHAQPQPQCFAQTHFCVRNQAFLSYFGTRGGARILGYPVSREFRLEGAQVQFFQRVVLQLDDSGIERVNVLDSEIMPLSRANGSKFPHADPRLAALAPQVGTQDYDQRIVNFIRSTTPNIWDGRSIGFFDQFNSTIPIELAFPDSAPSPDLAVLLNLEFWGAPTSAPEPDALNSKFVYQRFQRGIMHSREGISTSESILLGDYLKAVIMNQALPDDLRADMQASRLFNQYDRNASNWLRRPSELSNTNLTQAFEPEDQSLQPSVSPTISPPPSPSSVTPTSIAPTPLLTSGSPIPPPALIPLAADSLTAQPLTQTPPPSTTPTLTPIPSPTPTLQTHQSRVGRGPTGTAATNTGGSQMTSLPPDKAAWFAVFEILCLLVVTMFPICLLIWGSHRRRDAKIGAITSILARKRSQAQNGGSTPPAPRNPALASLNLLSEEQLERLLGDTLRDYEAGPDVSDATRVSVVLGVVMILGIGIFNLSIGIPLDEKSAPVVNTMVGLVGGLLSAIAGFFFSSKLAERTAKEPADGFRRPGELASAPPTTPPPATPPPPG